MKKLFLAAASAAIALNAWSHILVYNQDGTNFTATHGDDQMTADGLRAFLGTVIGGGQVTHFFFNLTGQAASFDSKTIPPSWWRLDTVKGEPPVCPRRDLLLHRNGVDVGQVYVDGCRARKVSPWYSMRMNDVHCVDDPSWWGHSKFRLDHPEFWCVPHAKGNGPWTRKALDYAHPEVRAYGLAFVKEVLERWDVDGLECDWMRFTEHLRPGRQREDAHYLTEFMREVRKLTDAAAARRGHPVRIAARVASRPDAALAHGTDAVQWAKEGLVDWVIPCNFFSSVDFDLPCADWKRRLAAVNPKVLVLPGADTGVVERDPETGRNGPRRMMTVEEYRGFADRMHRQGADGIYIFNLFTYFEPAYKTTDRKPWNFILNQGLEPAAIQDLPKSIPANWWYEN